MSQVSVRRADGNSATSQSILESLNGISDSIRNRAFQLFESRGADANSSNDVDDWLQAEQDLFSIPQAELIETDRDYRMQVAAPGFDAKNLEVIAGENMIVVRGTSAEQSKMLMRRFDFNSTIDTSAVTAQLGNGMLNITATKAGAKSSSATA